MLLILVTAQAPAERGTSAPARRNALLALLACCLERIPKRALRDDPGLGFHLLALLRALDEGAPAFLWELPAMARSARTALFFYGEREER